MNVKQEVCCQIIEILYKSTPRNERHQLRQTYHFTNVWNNLILSQFRLYFRGVESSSLYHRWNHYVRLSKFPPLLVGGETI
jgi:hypothetical protein